LLSVKLKLNTKLLIESQKLWLNNFLMAKQVKKVQLSIGLKLTEYQGYCIFQTDEANILVMKIENHFTSWTWMSVKSVKVITEIAPQQNIPAEV